MTVTVDATTKRLKLGIGTTTPQVEFVVQGKSQLNRGLSFLAPASSPTGATVTINWSLSNVQILNVANTNLTVTFARPLTGINTVFYSKLFLLINYSDNSNATLLFADPIKWENGVAFTKVSGVNNYLVQLAVSGNVNGVKYYGQY